jgi:pimeloyl-ACP methyl ester carboxylesterase
MADLNGQNIVLVHGAWHGGWCWRDVADRLIARGARVFCPTMTGLGDRRHLRAAYQGLETFIQDVTSLIEHEELTRITLVGHSFGGMVVTGVADRMQDRIKHIVYLDAVVPDDGHSMVAKPDTSPETVKETIEGLITLAPDGAWMQPIPLEAFGLADAPETLRARIARGLTEHPLSSWTDVLHFKNGGPKGPRTYIWCNQPPMERTSFQMHYENVLSGRYGPDWSAQTLATGHEAMFTMPTETADIIAKAALV